MARQHWTRAIATTVAGFMTAGTLAVPLACGQNPDALMTVPAGLRNTTASNAGPIQYLRFAHFTIPFDVDQTGRAPSEVHLWVSPDAGQSWLKYGTTTPDKRSFEFRAAAEGEYLFAVQTRDSRGDSTLAAAPPMHIVIDTSKPQLQLQADVNSSGRLVIDFQIADPHLAEESVRLAYRVDAQGNWEQVRTGNLQRSGENWTGRCELDMPRGHEIDLQLLASDLAQNTAEARTRFNAPRTASASSGLQLASQRGDQKDLNTSSRRSSPAMPQEGLSISSGGVPWNPSQPRAEEVGAPRNTGWTSAPATAPTSARTVSVLPESQSAPIPGNSLPSMNTGPGMNSGPAMSTGPAINKLPSSGAQPSLALESNGAFLDTLPGKNQPPAAGMSSGSVEELPVPVAVDPPQQPAEVHSVAASGANDAYHSRSRSFSLDYAIDSLRGMTLSDVELWGTEDRGRTWQKWGSDPDRQSPFDVQVASDGPFGFRMVIIGSNGLVSNRPQDGDPADMWIHVDTEMPRAKITRALYGEGAEAGMLVIDYNCEDGNLHDRPVTLSYSERTTGPWITIASGLRNTGSYSWKADPSLPAQVYVRIQAVDRAGNTAEHCLELPINLRGLAPRGRIQGFRPIDPK